MKNPWIVIGIVVVVLVGGSVAYSQYVATTSNEGVEVSDHIKGNPDAEVTLVEYSDFECPSCAQFYPYVQEVVDSYGDQIRFEYKHFPVINQTPGALMAVEAAGQQGAFFAYHDLMFENQSEWRGSTNPNSFFTQYAEEVGLDVDLWNTHRNASLLQDKIEADFADGRAMGVTGTPTFFLNGERMNIRTFADFTAQIEDALGVITEEDVEQTGSIEGSATVDLEAIERN